MNREELYQFLNAYTEGEQAYLRGGPKRAEYAHEYQQYSQKSAGKEKTYLFASEYFMTPQEQMSLNRQDRFEPVLSHSHDYIELCYVWSGKCVQHIEGKTVVSREGDVCIFDQEVVHSIEACGQEDIVVNILMRKEYFDGAFLTRMTKQGIVSEFLMEAVTRNKNKKHYLFFPSHGNQKVRQLMEEIFLEQHNRKLGYQEATDSYIVVLFTELLRTYLAERKEKEPSESPNGKLLSILDYMEKNYESCTLQETARHFGFNSAYLTSMLKEKTGRSFLEHLQELRLNQARMLLKSTSISVTEIVSLCGYSNMHFFYQKFKAAEGCTPKEYREKEIKT